MRAVERGMKIASAIPFVFASFVATVNSALAAPTEAQLTEQAKVTKNEAEHIALAQVPHGAVKSAEIENEKGHLVWSFDILQPNSRGITEILVDAKTGKIISKQNESPADQAREAAEDRKQAH